MAGHVGFEPAHILIAVPSRNVAQSTVGFIVIFPPGLHPGNGTAVEERHIEALRRRGPSQPVYFERRHQKGGKLLLRWNLIVPERIRARSWEEVA